MIIRSVFQLLLLGVIGGEVIHGPNGANGEVVHGPNGANGEVVHGANGPNGANGEVDHGPNGAASNREATVNQVENPPEQSNQFIWTRRRYRRETSECCSKVIVGSTGAASSVQWDRMGVYIATGNSLHGRNVYQHQNGTQHLFYLYGEYDGWLLGPTPGVNFGGIKNGEDGMCVHSGGGRGWGYYGGPDDTRDPISAYPHWKYNDRSLTVKCAPKTVYIDSRQIPDQTRSELLLGLYRQFRRPSPSSPTPLLSPSPTGPTLNMDVWQIHLTCAVSCSSTSFLLQVVTGRVDIILAGSHSPLDLATYCFTCHPVWAGRLSAGQSANLITRASQAHVYVYVIIVGYAEYVSLTVKVDSANLLKAKANVV